MDIADRVFKTSERQAFLTYKDHKDNFENAKQSRLINPCKQELGKVSKQILEKVVIFVRKATKYLQFKNTISVIQWFKSIQNKEKYSFIQFDICDYYASITKKLLNDAIEWAENYTPIGQDNKDIIFQVRKSFLFNQKQPWVKRKESDFDVAMGAYDSAEVTDLVGLFLLSKLQGLGLIVGLYRDDGLALSPFSPKENEKMKKDISKIFNDYGLKVTIQVNMKVVDYLDVTLDLMTGIHKPFIKPNTKPIYVHTMSNHPPSIIKNIPSNVNKRLSMLSSNEDVFKSSTKLHQEALNAAGHKHKLKFEKVDLNEMNQGKKKKKRQRRIHWFNPPYDMNVATKIGKKFFHILDTTIPPGHPLHKIFNRHTVKLSYSTMPNMLKRISVHNSRVSKAALALEDVTLVSDDHVPDHCNCNGRMGPCPLDGDCQKERSCIYSCKVTREDTGSVETYTGLASGTFKSRFYGHNRQMNNRATGTNGKGTKLSQHVWDLKDANIPFNTKWSILAKASSFNPITGKCRLCLKEVYYILFKPETASLNSRIEAFGYCQHKKQWALEKT